MNVNHSYRVFVLSFVSIAAFLIGRWSAGAGISNLYGLACMALVNLTIAIALWYARRREQGFYRTMMTRINEVYGSAKNSLK